MKPRVLIIVDDPALSHLIEHSLKETEVIKVISLYEAQKALIKQHFDLILIDLSLRDGDGLQFIAENIAWINTNHTSFIILDEEPKIATKVMAFNLGAEDYIQKPFDPLEFNARVNSKLAKLKISHMKKLSIADLSIDCEKYKVFQLVKEQEIDLGFTAYEFRIFHLLALHLDNIFSRSQILDHIWIDTHISDRTIDSHIAHIRKKIANSKVQINAIKFIGYRLCLKQ